MKKTILFFCLFLGGCTKTITVCPPIPEYEDGFSQQLAKELETIPENSAIIRAIGDYIILRDQVQACS